MKSIKIGDIAHQELKVFVATNKLKIEGTATAAILKYLIDRGHKFAKKNKLSDFEKAMK